jgi:hypothetical protein
MDYRTRIGFASFATPRGIPSAQAPARIEG